MRNGQVVRLHQGDYDKQTTYGANPLQQAQAFEAAGCTWLHLVDLDGARDGNLTHLAIIQQICKETRLKVEVGGGVRDNARIDQLLAAGVDRVILGTAALENWAWFESLMKHKPYHGKVVLGLDAKNGLVATRGWEKVMDRTAFDIARDVKGWPLAAIVYTDIAMDGTLKGPNYEATAQMAESTDVPVVASGGVGTLDHLRKLKQLKIQGAIVGKAIYENKFTVEEARQLLEGQ
jgi:phosphoribosylformimino-5-aminoimidazole carboxamide ribotide isomerase